MVPLKGCSSTISLGDDKLSETNNITITANSGEATAGIDCGAADGKGIHSTKSSANIRIPGSESAVSANGG